MGRMTSVGLVAAAAVATIGRGGYVLAQVGYPGAGYLLPGALRVSDQQRPGRVGVSGGLRAEPASVHEGSAANGDELPAADQRHHVTSRVVRARRAWACLSCREAEADGALRRLLGPGGTVRWPSAAPDGPARKAAEEAVKSAVAEHDKYGQATIRQVVDARNKLTEYLRESLPAVKEHNRADGDALERFVVELQKTLATLAVNY